MLVIAAASAALVMLAALSVERRLGPAAGGWLVALPIGFTVALTLVTVTDGRRLAAGTAISAAEHVPAQVTFAVLLAATLTRHGLVAAAVTGALGYVATSVGLAQLPDYAAIILAVLALVLAPRLITTAAARHTRTRPWSTVAVTCAASGLVVVGAVLASNAAGPGAGGAVAAFPTMSGALTIVIATCDGAAAATRVLYGLVRSLPCYLAYCLVAGYGLPALGLPALTLAAAACTVVATLSWRLVTDRQPTGQRAGVWRPSGPRHGVFARSVATRERRGDRAGAPDQSRAWDSAVSGSAAQLAGFIRDG